MSVTALRSAFKSISETKMSIPARLVLLALSNRHNQETWLCDTSNKAIRIDTQLSERSVRLALRELENLGLIKNNREVIR
jgi:predicted transcriptional regulator